ncbi:Fe-S cluster assembly transcriptional regulator IscR [Halopseudomonas phragmitis]|uniref:Fe-S cluster assembly transcriptional regulator IscR n=2 Tax=Pseudomonadaceae TaxID=135621 RepID=A0A1V0B7D2_9GAMM|nr:MULTISPECIES: Fe-S cluster assembly transcriptional regulator IscR [Pseudomonadaceae]AQZ95835.1 Fe-S cluster assembly transcriptional regulator IscR [Halopseudomonas phragmitis]PAU88746.1 Fe-S cluster assembly transcriptional regulator IscR [Pseudomonas sp. WN033]RHW21484.1 Fe-S cluster assembly transcriptional regulator IscR [Pseudomonas jilinensis]
MRLTTKGRYAVTAMLDLALHEDQGPITLADISMRQGVSISYLEQLFAKLRRSKLVESVRGPGGGYRLAGGAGAISVAQIVEAVNDSMDATRCMGKGDCQHGEVCLTHHLWSDLSDRLRQFLSDITLADLVSRDDIQRVRSRQDRGCSNGHESVVNLERII